MPSAQVRRPRGDKCPTCGAGVERAVVSDYKRGRCVVLWPCRDVFPLGDLYSVFPPEGQRGESDV